MKNGSVSFHSHVSFVRRSLVVIALLITGFSAVAHELHGQVPEPPEPTAKSAPSREGSSEPRLAQPLGASIGEGFEDGVMPPPGWTYLQTNPYLTWKVDDYLPHSGTYHALVPYDWRELQDEVLLSASFTATSGSVSLWSYGSPYWCRETYDLCDLEVWLVNGAWDWGGGDDVYLGQTDPDWTDEFTWSHSTFDFSAHACGTPARIALRYTGYDGAEISVDDILIDYSLVCNDPDEPNDTPGQAVPISTGTTLADPDICAAGDEDYYAFYGNAGDSVVADIDAQSIGSSLNSVLHLYDTDGVSELTYNDDWDGLDSHIQYTLPATGTYYLKTRSFAHPSCGRPDYFYTISLNDVGPVVYDSSIVDDDMSGESDGNNDGLVNPGENIELYVTLYNGGTSTATGVTATISTSDSYVTFLYNTSDDYPDVPGGGTATNSDDFELEVDSTAPCGHMIEFDMDLTASNGGPWSWSFGVPVGCSVYLPLVMKQY